MRVCPRQFALHSVLKPGTAADYEREHQRIPDDLVATFARVGIRGWTIWRSGEQLFHLVDCDDFAAAMDALADDPANQRWQAHIGTVVDRFLPDGPPTPLPEVWDLARQVVEDGRHDDQP